MQYNTTTSPQSACVGKADVFIQDTLLSRDTCQFGVIKGQVVAMGRRIQTEVILGVLLI